MEASNANVSGTRLMIGFVFPFYYCFLLLVYCYTNDKLTTCFVGLWNWLIN